MSDVTGDDEVLTCLCTSQMSGNLSGRHLEFHSVLPSLDLHNSFGEALVADDDLERRSHQVCIVELHTRSVIPVIPEYF